MDVRICEWVTVGGKGRTHACSDEGRCTRNGGVAAPAGRVGHWPGRSGEGGSSEVCGSEGDGGEGDGGEGGAARAVVAVERACLCAFWLARRARPTRELYLAADDSPESSRD